MAQVSCGMLWGIASSNVNYWTWVLRDVKKTQNSIEIQSINWTTHWLHQIESRWKAWYMIKYDHHERPVSSAEVN
jgi:hypothetical protein